MPTCWDCKAESESSVHSNEERPGESDQDLFLRTRQLLAKGYNLDQAGQELSRLIEKSAKEMGARRPEVGQGDACLDMLFWALPALIRSRDAPQGYCQLNGFCADGFSFPWCSFPLPSGLFTSEQEEQVPPFPLS